MHTAMAKRIVAYFALFIIALSANGQVSKMKTFGNKQHNVITSAISYDGSLLATAGDDNMLIVWDYHNGNVYRKLAGLTEWTKTLAFSRDGKMLASGGRDSKVYIWEIDKSAIKHTLNAHSGDVCAVCFSPDNALVASGGDDNTIRIWDAKTGRLLQTLNQHSKSVTSIDFCPTGQAMASASADGTVVIWDVAKWMANTTIDAHKGWVRCVAFSPNGTQLATCGDDKYVRTFSPAGAHKLEMKGHKNWVQSLSFSPDSRFIVSGSHDKTFIVWNAENGAEVYKSPSLGEIVYSVGFNPKGESILATNLRSSDLSLWDTKSLNISSSVAPSVTLALSEETQNIASSSITADDQPPMLSLKPAVFSDANNNSIIDAGEQAFIDITIQNSGNGLAKGVKVFIAENNSLSGIDFNPYYEIGDISAGSSKSVKVPILASEALQTASANFSITVTESRGYSCSPAQLAFATKKLEVPMVVLHEHAFTPINSDKIAKGSKFKLSLIVQNKGQATAYGIKVRFELPENAFIVSEPEFFIAQLTTQEYKAIDVEVMTNTRYIRPDVPIEVFITESIGKYGDRKIASARLNEGAQGNLNSLFIAQSPRNAEPVTPVLQTQIQSDIDVDIPQVAKPNSNRYALIIGNEDYSSHQRGLNTESDVEFAVHDAETFKKYAINLLGVPNENVILKTNATAMEMHRALSQINTIAKISEGKAEIFVMYAGHGFPDEKTQEPYLIPVDVSGADLQFAIKLSEFYAKLTEHPTKRVTVFLDACFSGGGREQGLIAARGVRVKPKENALKGNLVVFAATSGDQSALPWKEKGHGMFTYHLLQKLKETKGDISYNDLSEYLRTNVGTRSVIVNQKEQNPQTNVSADVVDSWTGWRFK